MPSGRLPVHGHTVGDQRTPEYVAWANMVQRCTRKTDSAAYYRDRGITVCARWRESFAAFVQDVGLRPSPEHSIDRRDNDRDYEPGNVRWATHSQQQSNKRSNRLITARGRTQTLTAWAREVGLKRGTISWRLDQGWTAERALCASLVPQSKRVYRRKAA